MAFVFRQSYRGRNLIPKSTKDDDTIGVTLLKEDIKFLLIQLNKAVREDRLLKSIRVIKMILTEWFQRQNEFK